MRVLVVLYHVGDELARIMERAGVPGPQVAQWCADWEDAVSGCTNMKALGWLRYADSLTRLIGRYHTSLDAQQVSNEVD